MSLWEHFFEFVEDWSLYIPITLPFEGVLWDVADASQVSCYALDTFGLCLSNCLQSRDTSHPRKPGFQVREEFIKQVSLPRHLRAGLP